MSFLYILVSGLIIGSFMVMPGVSGGVIAVILGIYDKMIYSLTNLFKDFKKSFIFLLLLTIGVAIGSIWFSNIIYYLYEKHEVITKLTFIGMILGGVPFLFTKIKSNGNKANYKIIIATFVFSLLLVVLSSKFSFLKIDGNSSSFLLFFLAGVVYASGKVIPGLSGSFLLILMGLYEFVLSVISNPIEMFLNNLNKLIPFILGLVVGVYIFLKLINYLLSKHFSIIYSIIIGFVLGSIFILIPSMSLSLEGLFGIMMMLLGGILSYKLSK